MQQLPTPLKHFWEDRCIIGHESHRCCRVACPTIVIRSRTEHRDVHSLSIVAVDDVAVGIPHKALPIATPTASREFDGRPPPSQFFPLLISMPLPYRSLPPASTPASGPLPEGSPRLSRRLGSYFSWQIWRQLWQQAARHRYWMKGAAIAYGTAFALLLGSCALLALTTVKPTLQASILSLLTPGLTDWAPPIAGLMEEMSTWRSWHRWGVLIVSVGVGGSLWLKVTGLTQQIIRSDGDLASHLIPTLKQRLITLLVAIANAGLALLAARLVLSALPAAATTEPTSWLDASSRILMHALRWGLALSTIALAFGMLYRSSQKSSVQAMPMLPGTILATLLWLGTWMVLEQHVATLGPQHWLWQIGSTLIYGCGGLYVTTLGVLLGGQYNKLIHRYVPPSPRSQSRAGAPPPPSFESFTIPKRPYR